MNLNEILKIVQEKYPDAHIKKNALFLEDIDIHYAKYIELIDNVIFYNDNSDLITEIFNNIIELKHYLCIEITWKDLLEQFKNINNSNYFNVIDFNSIHFYNEGTIEIPDGVITTKRSLWQIYNILKNVDRRRGKK